MSDYSAALPREHHIAVAKTARYFTLGEPGSDVREVWFVLHGFGQLAGLFIRDFAPITDSARLVVAPEALSRFYLDPGGGRSPQARVGATWMTREERLVEIGDYVGYLDTLYDHVLGLVPRAGARVVALGFSQGVATAARWACRGRARLDHLVLWAGTLPPELGHDDVAPLRAMRVTRVVGEGDEFAGADLVAAEEARVAALGLAAPLLRFAGGHELNADVLLRLAS